MSKKEKPKSQDLIKILFFLKNMGKKSSSKK
jgi:hypothetical protein